MYKCLFFIVFSVLFLVIRCEQFESNKCGDDLQCAEDKLIGFVNEIDKNGSISVLGDFLVLEKRNGREENTAKDLFERCLNFIQGRELKLRIPQRIGRSLKEESRTKKKIRRRFLLPLLIVLALKGFIEFPALLAIVGLVAFKGLGVGLVSLAVAGSVGLKHFLEASYHHHQPSKLTYEIIPSLAGPSLGPHWSRGENLIPSSPVPEMYP